MKMLIEGYWRSESAHPHDTEYPSVFAFVRGTPISRDFIKKLSDVERLAKVIYYRGHSKCRVCGCTNGSTEFHYKDWYWPQGYMHYLTVHNVHPSDAFFKFITEINTCTYCHGYGMCAIACPTPMTKLEFELGLPTFECPRCHVNANPFATFNYAIAVEKMKALFHEFDTQNKGNKNEHKI